LTLVTDRLIAIARGDTAWSVEQFALVSNRPDFVLDEIGSDNGVLREYLEQFVFRRAEKFRRYESATFVESYEALPSTSILTARRSNWDAHVTVSFASSGEPINRYRVYVNSVLVQEQFFDAPMNDFDKEVAIRLGGELSRVELSCLTISGLESPRAAVSFSGLPSRPGTLFFVGFGVSDYDDPDLTLDFAAKDALDLETALRRRALRNGMGFESTVYTDADVNTEALTEAREFLCHATEHDIAVVFIAGHGVQAAAHENTERMDYFFLPSTTAIDNITGTGIPFEEFESLWEGLAVVDRLFLIDTCDSGEASVSNHSYSGAPSTVYSSYSPRAIRGIRPIGTETITPISLRSATERFVMRDIRRAVGALTISSSQAFEYSYESPEWQNGAFTEAILEVIQNEDHDTSVSVRALQRHILSRVPELTGGMQNPVVDYDNILLEFGF
jgi:hypothetical protein